MYRESRWREGGGMPVGKHFIWKTYCHLLICEQSSIDSLNYFTKKRTFCNCSQTLRVEWYARWTSVKCWSDNRCVPGQFVLWRPDAAPFCCVNNKSIRWARVMNWKSVCVVLCCCVQCVEIYTEQRAFAESMNFLFSFEENGRRIILITSRS